MFEYLEILDQQLFLYLNQFHSPFFDELMRWITHRFTWIPLYILLAYLAYVKMSIKHFLLMLCMAIVLIFLSDQLSVHLFKNIFLRYRPCHNLLLQNKIHLINGCGGLYGFVSSHASNTFALAVFMGILLHSHYKKIFVALLIWAVIVSYSRIYAGVHYPADIIVGALLGSILALIMQKIYQRFEKKLE
ncbi:MAG: phosphatase PAP2 family protein [Bacteroidia bacterium]